MFENQDIMRALRESPLIQQWVFDQLIHSICSRLPYDESLIYEAFASTSRECLCIITQMVQRKTPGYSRELRLAIFIATVVEMYRRSGSSANNWPAATATACEYEYA